MSIRKQYLKSKPICKVTFKVDPETANNASHISLVGDFNEWNEKAHEMKANKDGSFTFTLDLETGREYQFRYLADGHVWLNEFDVDKMVQSSFYDAQNSVIVL